MEECIPVFKTAIYCYEQFINSDGTTILGADDKAGIAEILTMIEYITANNIEHPAICVAFTPDEEIGMGTQHFDVERFGADYARR